MKKKLILMPLAGALLYMILSGYSEGPAYYVGYDRTGATGTAGCSTGSCHAASATATTVVSVTLLSGGTPVTTYTPGATYTIRISGENTSSSNLPSFGFQVSVVKVVSGVTSDAGSMTSAPSGTHVCASCISGYSVSIWEHYNAGRSAAIPATTLVGSGGAGTTYTEDITWTAPSSGTGCIIIYGVLNAVNGNGSADAGDLWNTTSLVINESVAGITGAASVCAGATTTLSDATPCGSWSSASSGIAAVGSGTGIVTGVSAGTATISYTAGAGNLATKTVTVIAAPSNISGTTAVCVGSNTTLSDASGLGTWISGNTVVATANLITGTVTGVSASTATITFTAASNSCKTSATVTVNPLPSAITGPEILCTGTISALTDAGSGTWISGNTTIATIGLSTGIITTGTSGTSVITYTLPTGCSANITMTVNPAPTPITGSLVVCPGFTTALTDAGGSTWSSGNTSVATVITGTGVVTGVSGGTSTITFTAATGCNATATVTVNPLPPPVTGAANICAGLTSALTDAATGGTWTSTNTSIATIGASSGIVTAVAGRGGTSVITYTVPVTGCVNTTTVTVNPLPSGITGKLGLCQAATTTLSDATGAGNWTSSNTSVATIGFSGALVVGIAAGTTTITYTLGTGCKATAALTVDPSPPAISGIAVICSGLTTGLSDASGGGTWASGNTGIATIGSSTGVVTAVGILGNSVITYTLPVTGCATVKTVTVNPVPPAISGTAIICSGATTPFSSSGGGTWSSGNTAIATVSGTGLVTGIGAGGTATITYAFITTGCFSTKVVTVNPLPPAISGITRVCTGSTITLSDAAAGGTWASSNTAAATIGSSTGIITGLGTGGTTSLITYTLTTGCKISSVVTVNPLPAGISGLASECIGTSATLSDGTSGGAWSSNNTAVATVGSASGIVSGAGAGTAAVSYTLSATGCSVSKNVTVNLLPSAISGSALICAGSATALSDAGGGTWKSGATAIATVGSGTGIVTGVSGGTAAITYTLPVTGCVATQTITVNPLSPVTGITSLCGGLTTTLSDATTGGTWASSNTLVATIGSGSGFVTGGSPGTTTINYTLPTGCIATTTVSIVSAPSAISGSSIVCSGLTSALTDAGGGTWTSGKTIVATVGAGTGTVTGISLGTATITYSLGTGCVATMDVTVDPVPSGITGVAAVCAGGGTTVLSDGATGGVWSSSNANASVGSTGTVTGVTAGNSVISYTINTGCSAFKTVTVNPLPVPIAGADSVCIGSTTLLSDAGGGTWSSSNTGAATVGLSSGIVVSVSVGTATIFYTLPVTGCTAGITVTMNPLPSPISGSVIVCAGATTVLSDGISRGSWTSSNTNAAIGYTSGILAGVNAGTATIVYSLSTGCSVAKTATVNPVPAAITGIATVCAGNATALSDVTGGGKWSSSSLGIATIGTISGLATGLSPGTSTVIYTLFATGCSAGVTLTVDSLPSAITGMASMCAGFTTTLIDTTVGGMWSSSNTVVATVGSGTGIIAGITGGTATITYVLATTGCKTLSAITVDPLPSGITGAAAVCTGSITRLSDATTGGSWTSGNSGIATIIPGTGVVTGISAGSVIVTYALSTGCEAHFLVTVDPLPPAISGSNVLCAGAATALSDTTSGAWSSSNTAVATVGSGTGNVSGVSAGTATITYALATGCASAIVVTVNPLPSPVSGTTHVCAGLTSALSDGTAGGAWSSSTTTVATVGTGTGVVSTIAPGVTIIAYTLATGCMSTVNVTVNPLPPGITGTSHVCAGSTTALSDASGGTWHSSNTAVGTVSGAGVVSGIAAGTTTITYTLPAGCTATIVVTVNPLPVAGTISGPTIICIVSPGTLSDGIAGGSWSSSDVSIATVDAGTGVVTGISTGVVLISYTVTNSCGTVHTSLTDTIADIASAGIITGSDSVCADDSVMLGDTVTGGIWTSSNANATVSATGTITGITAGSSVISYSKTTLCGTATTTWLITVNAASFCKTGVDILPGATDFKVYPNPSQGEFIVEIPATVNGATITITDVLGKVVDRRRVNDTGIQKVAFDLRNTPPGSYMVKANAGDKIYRQKIVIW